MVAAGRADFFVTDVPQGNDGIKASGLPAGTIAVSDAVLEVQSLHFIVGKSGPNAKANLEKFEQGLEAIRKSGVYAKAVGLFNM
jgi:polar amino acid transport system substrate-binding protein